MTIDEMECIDEGGTELTIALLRRLGAALVLQPHFEIMDPALIVEPAGAGLVAAAPV